jgi:hypothetical protein
MTVCFPSCYVFIICILSRHASTHFHISRYISSVNGHVIPRNPYVVNFSDVAHGIMTTDNHLETVVPSSKSHVFKYRQDAT